MGYGRAEPQQEWTPVPPPTLPPSTAADIARQMTQGVIGLTVATAAIGAIGLGIKAAADAVSAIIAMR
jgi:hypothetical protein